MPASSFLQFLLEANVLQVADARSVRVSMATTAAGRRQTSLRGIQRELYVRFRVILFSHFRFDVVILTFLRLYAAGFENADAVILTVSSSAARLWTTADGGPIWEHAFARPTSTGSASLLSDGNVVVLHDHGLTMLNGLDGKEIWSADFGEKDS